MQVQDDVHSDAHSSPDVDFEAEITHLVENSKVMSNPEMLLSHLSDSERRAAVEMSVEFPDPLSCAEALYIRWV